MTICCISFHPCRSIRKQIWPSHKNGHGQPSVIIWTHLVVLEYLMLYTKFPGHQPLGSEEGDFWRFYQKCAWTPSWSFDPETFENTFIPTSHGGSTWNLASNGQVFFFLGKDVWKCWIWVTLDKGQWMALTLGCHKLSCTHLFDYMYT